MQTYAQYHRPAARLNPMPSLLRHANEIFETLELPFEGGASLRGSIISATFPSEYYGDKTIHVQVSLLDDAESVAERLKAELQEYYEDQAALHEGWEHPRHTQGY